LLEPAHFFSPWKGEVESGRRPVGREMEEIKKNLPHSSKFISKDLSDVRMQDEDCGFKFRIPKSTFRNLKVGRLHNFDFKLFGLARWVLENNHKRSGLARRGNHLLLRLRFNDHFPLKKFDGLFL